VEVLVGVAVGVLVGSVVSVGVATSEEGTHGYDRHGPDGHAAEASVAAGSRHGP